MNFYRHRPLALAISLCLAVSSAVLFMAGGFKIILALLIPIIAFIIILLLRRFEIAEICNLKAAPFVLIASALCMCFLLTSFAYFNVYAARYESLTEGNIIATVTDVVSQKTYGATYAVRLQSLSGKRMSGRGLLRSDNATALSAGDVVRADVQFVSSEEFYGVFDTSEMEMLADGYLFTCYAEDAIVVACKKSDPEAFFTRLRESFAAKMSLYTDGDASAMANALFLGDRSGLGKIYRDFIKSGIIHILALSGMHLAILTGGLEKLFRFAGIHGKLKSVPIILFVVFYVALTGFLMSVVRAAIMVLLVQLAAAVDSRADPVTSLFIAVGLMVLVSPASLCDIGLQLSFFATLGVMLFKEELDRHTDGKAYDGIRGIVKKLLLALVGSMASSVGASMFVLPLQWLYFGQFSLVGIPATMLMSVVCEWLLLLYPPLLVCGMLGLDGAAYLVGGAVDLISRITADIAAFFAELASPISLEYPFVLPLVICLVSAITYMVVKNCRSWFSALIPLCLFFTFYLGGVGIYERMHYDDASVDFVNLKAHDTLILTSQRRAMIIDISNGSGTVLSLAGNRVYQRYLTSVDTLLLTDTSPKHISGVRSFLKYNEIRRVLIPVPRDESEYSAVNEMGELADEYGAEIVLYSREGEYEMSFGDLTITFAERGYLSRSIQPLEAIRISSGETAVTYVNRSSWESEQLWSFTEESDCVFFGCNGPNYRNPPTSAFSDNIVRINVPDSDYLPMLGAAVKEFEGKITVGSHASVELSHSD